MRGALFICNVGSAEQLALGLVFAVCGEQLSISSTKSIILNQLIKNLIRTLVVYNIIHSKSDIHAAFIDCQIFDRTFPLARHVIIWKVIKIFQTIIYSKHFYLQMRKQPIVQHQHNKENRYDQFTNLGIDLEGEINKSIVLPRIYHKAAEMEAIEYAKRQKQQEEQNIRRLKYEVDHLKRNVFRMNEESFLPGRFRTQLGNSRQFQHYYHSPRNMECYHQDNQMEIDIDQSRYLSRVRIPRNTDKNQHNNRRNQPHDEVMDGKESLKFKEKANNNVKSIKETSPTMVRLEIAKHTHRNIQKDMVTSVTLQKQAIKTNKKRVRRSPKLRKFRICVYAVYFSLLIPAFARKLYKNRLTLFISNYPHEVTKYFGKKQNASVSKYKLDESKLWTLLAQKIDILEMIEKDNLGNCLHNGGEVKQIKKHFDYLISTYELKSSDNSIAEPLTFQEQMMYPKNIEILLPKIRIVFDKIMNGFYQNLTTSDFLNDKWKTVDIGLMNNSFVNNSHPKLPALLIDCGIVRLHPDKQYLLVYDEETEVLLLINDLLCRIFIYKWLNRLQKFKGGEQYSEQSLLISTFILTIFYVISSEIIEEKVTQYIKANQKYDQKAKYRNTQLRAINSLIVGKKKGVKIQKGSLIANPPHYVNALEIVKSHPDFVEGIKEMLKETGAELYDKMKTYKKKQLTQIKDKTAQQLNIIRNDKRNKEKVATLDIGSNIVEDNSDETTKNISNVNLKVK